MLDALDEEQTIFSAPRSYAGGARSIIRAKFKEQVIGENLLFRLPGKRYFAQDSDYATEPFIELCQQYELTGLEFMETFTAEFIATSKKHTAQAGLRGPEPKRNVTKAGTTQGQPAGESGTPFPCGEEPVWSSQDAVSRAGEECRAAIYAIRSGQPCWLVA